MDKLDVFNANAIEIDCVSKLNSLVYKDHMSRFNYKTVYFKYYGLVRKPKKVSDKLYVFLHGAKDREKNKEPYFDRWSWVDVFDGYMLSFSDPTLQLDKKLGLAWYGGNYSEHPLEIILSIVDYFLNIFNIKTENVIFWGSSGGGYASIYASLRLNGSKAITFNPQCNALNYHERHVKRYLDIGFGVDDANMLKGDILQRLTICDDWIKRTTSQIAIFQNTKDEFHYYNHFLDLKNRVKALKSKNFQFYTYSDDKGHGPENKLFAKDVSKNMTNVFKSKYIVYESKDSVMIEVNDLYVSQFLQSNGKQSPEAYLEIFKAISEVSKNKISKPKVEELYSQAIKAYPGGWNLKYLYAKYKSNINENSESLKVLLEICDKFKLKNSKVPGKVVKELNKVSKKLCL